MNPVGAFITVISCLAVILGSKRLAAVTIIAGTCYLTQGQELNLGFHFTAIRLILLAAFLRVLARGELKQIRTNSVDRALLIYALGVTAIATLRVGTADQFVYQAGNLYNICLSYFAFRALLTESDNLGNVLSLLAIVMAPAAAMMVREAWTGYNIFSTFGGVSAYSMFRDGHVRCQGAFRSPITSGAFGATFAMLFASVGFAKGMRWKIMIGFIASVTVVVCARSSGPLLGMMIGGIAFACWRFREHTRKIRWGIVITLVSLHLVMKAPVWFLLGRISDVVGGGGYHRAYLIDNFVNRFGSWWLAGTSDTSGWMATELSFGGTDITNQFVSDGINGGLLGLILSILLLVRCFQFLGTGISDNSENSPQDPSGAKLLWGQGATLVGSIGILFSVTYFDQMHVIWYFLLAVVGSSAGTLDMRATVGLPAAHSQTRDAHQERSSSFPHAQEPR